MDKTAERMASALPTFLSNFNISSEEHFDLNSSKTAIVLSELPSSTNKKLYCGNAVKISMKPS